MKIRNKNDQKQKQKERLRAYAERLSLFFAGRKEVQNEKRRLADQ